MLYLGVWTGIPASETLWIRHWSNQGFDYLIWYYLIKDKHFHQIRVKQRETSDGFCYTQNMFFLFFSFFFLCTFLLWFTLQTICLHDLTAAWGRIFLNAGAILTRMTLICIICMMYKNVWRTSKLITFVTFLISLVWSLEIFFYIYIISIILSTTYVAKGWLYMSCYITANGLMCNKKLLKSWHNMFLALQLS